MEEIIMSIIDTYAPMALQLLLVAMFGALGMIAEKYIKSEHARAIVRDAVGFVEQVCKEIHGHDKYMEALKAASEDLEELHIHISPKRLEKMIESAVCELNKQSDILTVEGVSEEDLARMTAHTEE